MMVTGTKKDSTSGRFVILGSSVWLPLLQDAFIFGILDTVPFFGAQFVVVFLYRDRFIMSRFLFPPKCQHKET
jgi:hypothetical protein